MTREPSPSLSIQIILNINRKTFEIKLELSIKANTDKYKMYSKNLKQLEKTDVYKFIYMLGDFLDHI